MKEFRYDISFLRAISVIFVLLYHFKFSLFQGGFIGVDIFFVISGYLMTMIILNGFEKNHFKLLDFYKRRVVRIIPPLLFLIISFGFVVYFILPTQFFNYSKSAFSSSLFFSNIYYYLNSNYFDASAQYNFLLHTWSLSVEWQFYMIYPLLLLIFRKIYINNIKVFKLIFLGLILTSIASMLIHNVLDSSYSFYIFYPRSWEMMAGGLAFLYQDKNKQLSIKSKSVIFYISLLMIFYCIFKINEEEYKWPSLLTVIPVVATTAIIFINLEIKLFKNKIITFLGEISYSLYLWHWPIYVMSLYYGLSNQLKYKFIFISLSFAGAIFSYYIIEKRDFKKYSIQIIVSAIACFGLYFGVNYINPNLIFKDKKISNLSYYASNYKYSEGATKQYNFETKHFLHTQKFSEWNKSVLKVDSNKKNVVLLGDSHAGMFAESFEELAKTNHWNLIQITADATYPMHNSKTNFIECQKYFNYIFSEFFAKNHNNIDLIILNSNYIAYDKNELKEKIEWTENYFKNLDIKTIYIGQNRDYKLDFPTTFYLNKQQKFSSLNEINELLKSTLRDKYIDLNKINIDEVSNNGIPYTYDQGHLTKYGTDEYMKFIIPFIPKHLRL